jgi:hypothetical protein
MTQVHSISITSNASSIDSISSASSFARSGE